MGALKPALVLLTLLALSACAPRDALLRYWGLTPPRLADFPSDFTPPVSAATGEPMPGFGGGGGAKPGIVPVIFVHGNTVSARFWQPARAQFLAAGYPPDALWAFGYGWDGVRQFDSNDLAVPSLERMVTAVTTYLERKTGAPVPQVDLVAHSLGVTLVRQWLLQTNGYHRVRSFVGIAGANEGVWTAGLDARGQNRIVAFELAPDGPWLAQLNRAGGAVGPTRYFMLYDGSGWGDVLFPKPREQAPALPGARNLAFNLEQNTHFDHLELARRPEPLAAVIDFLREAPKPDPEAAAPRVVQTGATVSAQPPGARLHCRDDARLPGRDDPAVDSLQLTPGAILTCFAYDPRSHRASPLSRHRLPAPRSAREPALTADPPPGRHAHPVRVTLSSEDPEAVILYTLNGGRPTTGSPRYTEPIFIAGPVRLTAAVWRADGSLSEPQVLDYAVSLERLEAESAWRRQFEADRPVLDRERRHKGR